MIKLLSAVYEAYNRAVPDEDGKWNQWSPKLLNGVLTTYCNFAVNLICQAFGYTKFTAGDLPVSANAMASSMSDPNGDWLNVSGEVAQAHANDGCLVIAAQSNPGSHGHVCIIIPGELQMSGHFGKQVPVVMNVGKDVFIGKSAAWAFQIEPTYYVLKSTFV